MEELIYEGKVSKSIGLALLLELNLLFLLCSTLYLRATYFWNFTVVYADKKEQPSDQGKKKKTITMANKDKT